MDTAQMGIDYPAYPRYTPGIVTSVISVTDAPIRTKLTSAYASERRYTAGVQQFKKTGDRCDSLGLLSLLL